MIMSAHDGRWYSLLRVTNPGGPGQVYMVRTDAQCSGATLKWILEKIRQTLWANDYINGQTTWLQILDLLADKGSPILIQGELAKWNIEIFVWQSDLLLVDQRKERVQ